MFQATASQLQNKMFGLSLIFAPILLLVSSIVLGTGSEGLSGTIQIYSFLPFLLAVFGLTQLLMQPAPRLAIVCRVLAVFGCIGGINYGMASVIHSTVAQTGASQPALMELEEAIEVGLPLVLNIPGIVFPLSMIILGIALWRTKVAPAWTGLTLAAAGLLFPISRIPDILILYYFADALFIVSLGWMGLRYLSSDATEMALQPT